MARDSFLLRIDPLVLAALRRWADDDLRSVNAQIDFLLRKSLKDAGRWPAPTVPPTTPPPSPPASPLPPTGSAD